MKFVLEQTPAESACYRLAKLDVKAFPDIAIDFVNGDKDKGEIYYTNSTQLAIGHDTDPLTRAYQEGKFHDMIEAGAITHIWLGERRPPASSIANLVTKMFRETRNAQVAFSPEFTSCNACQKVTRGLEERCGHCGSENVYGITRVTGYFSRVTGWNPGKRGELRERYRTKKIDGNGGVSLPHVEGNGKLLLFGVEPNEYTSRDCEKCTDARKVLTSRGIPFDFHNINSPEGLALLSKLDLTGAADKALPVAVYKGKVFDSVLQAAQTCSQDDGN